MNGLVGLICLSALLLAVSGQLSNLSPSYSLQGSLQRTENGEPTLVATFSVSVDINQRLQFVEESVSTTTGITSDNIRLSSENDDATYLSVNQVCSSVAFDPNAIFPLNTNVWDLYAAGTEPSPGTYNFTENGIIHQVTIINGIPLSFNFTFGNTEIIIEVFNFTNAIPPFSTFSLPSECSQFTCNSCYQIGFPVISPSYTVTGSGLITEFGQPSDTFAFKFSVDINRQLQYLKESSTTSSGITNFKEISSGTDQATYTSVNGFCFFTTDYDPILNFPIDDNVWELYAAGTESPTGTYTFTANGVAHRVVLEDGLPTVFSFSSGTTVLTLDVYNFRNTTPEFSTFCLPSECSRYSCIACYNSAVSVSISIMLLLTTLLMYFFTTL